jgi:hypothetical protein
VRALTYRGAPPSGPRGEPRAVHGGDELDDACSGKRLPGRWSEVTFDDRPAARGLGESPNDSSVVRRGIGAKQTHPGGLQRSSHHAEQISASGWGAAQRDRIESLAAAAVMGNDGVRGEPVAHPGDIDP